MFMEKEYFAKKRKCLIFPLFIYFNFILYVAGYTQYRQGKSQLNLNYSIRVFLAIEINITFLY